MKNNTANFDNNIYCIRGGVGFGSGESSYAVTPKTYERVCNMKNMEEVSQNTFLNTLDADVNNINMCTGADITVASNYENVPYNNYKAILWLIDNMYLPKLTSLQNDGVSDTVISTMKNEMKENLLKAAFNDIEGAIDTTSAETIADQLELDDNDIEVIQQLALWHFTNNKILNSGNDAIAKYDVVSYTDNGSNKNMEYQLRIFNSGNSQVNVLKMGTIATSTTPDNSASFTGFPLTDTSNKQVNAEILFTYLVHSAMRNANTYTPTLVDPVKFENTTLKMINQNDNKLIGPFKMTIENTNLDFTLTIPQIKDQDDNAINSYSIAYVEGENTITIASSELTSDRMKTLIGKEFYVVLPATSTVTGISLTLDQKYFDTSASFWKAQGNNTDAEQPVAMIDKQQIVKTLKKSIDSNFDLALRKFITAVNGEELKTGDKYTREPKFNIIDGKYIYTHPKDEAAVPVESGDIVTYTLRIYNQGTIDGYAQIVRDDIPTYLKFLPNNQINREYGWTEKTLNGKTVIETNYLQYNENDTQHRTLLEAFDKKTMTEPKYLDIKVAFQVTAPNSYKNLVVNTAEIAEDADKYGQPIDDIDSIPGNGNEEGKDQYHNFKEDDIDKEYVKLKIFDLALRKFITGVNDTNITTRVPQVNIAENGKITYTHPKTPVSVHSQDKVIYTIRIYNEGETAGYAEEITDFIPEGTEFIVDDPINVQYRWKLKDDAKTITTDYLSTRDENNLLNAFGGTEEKLDYKDIKIALKVIEPDSTTKNYLENIAEITEDKDKNNNPVDDIDSTPNNKNDETRDSNGGFNEDDTDFERIKLEIFDLALRKFITAVDDKVIDTRIPEPMFNDDKNRFIYVHPKDPILVANGNIVTYTIRVYNEGTVDGYAQTIYDDVPQNLEFIPDNATNMQYGWKVSSDGKSLTTDYLSKEKADGNLIVAFDKNTMQTPEYKDIKIAFKVNGKDLPSDKILINTAEIAEDADKDGNPVVDIDSIPGNKNEDGKDENHNFKEDDIDKEYVRVQYFDLSLLKWVSKVITTVDGKTTERDTGHTGLENPEPVVKEEIKRNKINSTTVKFGYTIRITNEGEIAGYAKEISDYIPEGLRFVQEDNPGWTEADGKVTTNLLENRLLQPGESADVTIILTWINNSENMGVKVNTAEISKDYNDYNVPDIDSTPNNKVPGEDDIDDAPVALSISTGGRTVVYFGLISAILAALIGGVTLIKRYII